MLFRDPVDFPFCLYIFTEAPSGPFQSESMVVEEASMCWTEACCGLHEKGAKTGTIVQKTNLYEGQMISLKQIQLYTVIVKDSVNLLHVSETNQPFS